MALKDDLKHALRLELTKPRFALLVILTLALGMGATTAIFSLVNAIVLSALPYRDSAQLAILLENHPNQGNSCASYPNFLDWRRMSQTMEDVACYRPSNSVIIGETGAERVPNKIVSAGFFRTLGANLQFGREFTRDEDAVGGPPSVVIGHAVWQRYFAAKPDAVGETLNIDGVSRTVVGILPSSFRFAGDAQVFLPIHPVAYQEVRFNRDALYVVGRVRQGSTIETARAEMKVIAEQLERQYPKENKDKKIELIPVDQWLSGNLGEVSLILFRAVGLVLLLACVNVAGLFLARMGERRKEYAVRSAVGAQRGQLIRQSLVESLVLAVQGGLVGLLLARPFLSALGGFVAPEQLDAVRLDWRVVSFALALSCLTAIAFGVFPALTVARTNLNESLKDRSEAQTSSHHRFRDILVVSQVAVALVLLIGSGLMLRTVLSLLAIPIGIRAEGIVTMQIQGPESKFTRQSQTADGFDVQTYVTLWRDYDREILERVQSLPGVEAAAMTYPLLFSGGTAIFGIHFEGRDSEPPPLHRYSVSPDYFKVMGIPLLKGRGFTMADDWGKPNVAIINATAARLCSPDRDPVGRRFTVANLKEWGEYTVVGVVGDTRHDNLSTPPPPQIYLSFLQWPSTIILTIRTKLDPASMASIVRREVASFDKEAPVYDVHAMEDHLAGATAPSRRIATVLVVLAGLALVLAAVGVYAVMNQVVLQRKHEIGVRIAVGASPSRILGMVIRKAMLLTLVGGVLGLLGSVAFARVLRQWLVGVSTSDPLTYAGVGLLVTMMSLLASYWPARRAASTDPIATLRCE